MNKRFLLSLLLCCFTLSIFAQQPFATCFHVSDVENWTAGANPDDPFNRSVIPLQSRISETNSTAIKANSNQYVEGQHAPAIMVTISASDCKSQGEPNFGGTNFTYWQYSDMLIWWAGSAGEGVAYIPDAGTTDVCHLYGCKVLGQIFFAPTAYGGSTGVLTAFKTTAIAQKCAEIANYYGFDGWFINEETSNSESGWSAWIQAYQNYCTQKGWTQHIQWYNATSGTTSLTSLTNTSKFMEYGATGNASSNFTKYYWGIECAQEVYGSGSYFSNLFPTSGHKGSLASFNPCYKRYKQPYWDNSSYLNGGANMTGTVAYNAISGFFDKEATWWVNSSHNPSVGTRSGSWPGLATAMVERSAITSLPFVSSFSHGQGKKRYVNGEAKGTGDWYHHGMQDILPTWRYWSSGTATITPYWDDAYNMGTSLKVVNSTANNKIYLYKTKFTNSTGTVAKIAVKGATNLKLLVSNTAGAGQIASNLTYQTLSATSTETRNGWTILTYNLGSVSGTITAVGIQAPSTGTFYLGQLALLPANYNPTHNSVTDLTCQNEQAEDKGSARLTWTAAAGDDVHHYNIYIVRDGVTTLVGQTRDNAFYIPPFDRNGKTDTGFEIIIKTVTKDLEEDATGITLPISFPEMAKPVVSISAYPTLTKVNTNVTLTATANNFPTGYNWVVPGATIVSGQGTATCVVKWATEGRKDITCEVTNEIGTTSKTEPKYINVNATTYSCANISSSYGMVSNLATNKTITVSGAVSTTEGGPKFVDNSYSATSNKWCTGATSNPGDTWCIIDLGADYELYECRLFDCGVKEGDTSYDQVENFYIELSQDKNTWDTIAHVTGRPNKVQSSGVNNDNVVAVGVRPTIGRYVRFCPYQSEGTGTYRLYEFQVFGCTYTTDFKVTVPTVVMDPNTTVSVTASYVDAASEPTANISLANSSLAQISNVVVNHDADGSGTITFDLTSGVTEGSTNLSVRLTDSNETVAGSATLKVIDPENLNCISGAACQYKTGTTNISNTAALITNGTVTTAMSNEVLTDNLTLRYSRTSLQRAMFDFTCQEALAPGLGEAWRQVVVYLTSTYTGTMTVYVSSNGTSWTQIGTTSSIATTNTFNVADATKKTITGAYKYVRVYMTITANGSISIAEVMGYKTDMTVGIKAPQAESLRIYPNPISRGEELQVEVPNMEQVKVYTLQGTVVLNRAASGSFTTIATSNLATGIYLLEVTDASGNVTMSKITIK